jgi:hypothetical protein
MAARCRQMADKSDDEETRRFWLAFERRWLQQADDLKPRPMLVST